jgi:hypothetical protein
MVKSGAVGVIVTITIFYACNIRTKALYWFCQWASSFDWKIDERERQMVIEFDGKIVFWRGPAPWYFVTVPEMQSQDLKVLSRLVTYGWGVIPVHVRIGQTEWKTSLFPKDGLYLVPIRANVRRVEDLDVGDVVTVRLEISGGS